MSVDRETLAAVAGMIRRNCTPSSEAYQGGGDALVYAVADWVENPPEWVLALSTQPAAGEVEWEYAVADPAHDFAYMVIAGKPTPGAKAMRRRPAGPWIKVEQ